MECPVPAQKSPRRGPPYLRHHAGADMVASIPAGCPDRRQL